MISDNKFSEIFLTCDTREQSAIIRNRKVPSAIIKGKLLSEYTNEQIINLTKRRPRIWTLSNYCMKRGAEVVIDTLDRCDYSIQGFWNGKFVNIGIEYKTMEDIARSIKDLEWKLPECYKYYDTVCLFVEGRQDIIKRDKFYYMRNYREKDASVLRFDNFVSKMEIWRSQGIIVREFEKECMFPVVLEDVLNWVTKPVHKTFSAKLQTNEDLVIKMLSQIPGMGIKSIMKILDTYPNTSIKDLLGYSSEDLKNLIGKDKGKRLYCALNNIEMMDYERR